MAIDIAEFTELDAVAADARGSLDREQQASLFDRVDWYRLLVRHCPFPGTPLILRARDDQGTAWLFLSRQGRRAFALANWYAFETGVVSHGTVRPALLEALAYHLRVVDRFKTVELAPLGKARLAAMTTPFRAAGWTVRTDTTTINWTLPVTGDWESYLEGRSRRLVNTLRRKQKAGAFSIDISDIFSEDKWQYYEQVYDLSWKPVEGSPRFLRALAEQESHAGTFRLGLAFDGTAPVAAQFWLIENGTATIHKLAHVEARRGQSPGTILTAAMFRHAIDQDRVRRIDFGTGDDAYKADWMDQPEPLYRLSLFNPGTLGGILGAARESLSGARAKIRRAR